MATFLLLDGNSLTYRAFFALPTDMVTSSGQVTNAVFGFTSMLINLLKDHRPDGIVVAWDRAEPTFRHIEVPEYKAQREAAPDILRQQLGLVRQVLATLGIRQVELAGYEADDLIATMATELAERGDDVIVVTGDRDSYQLVADPHVKVLYNRRGVSDYALYDEAGIRERTGVTPAQYPEYAALRGDPSDNLDGVPGVGEKTAAKLISTYGSIAGVLDALDAQTPKLRAALAEHGERVARNARIMVLDRRVPLGAIEGGVEGRDADVAGIDYDACRIAPPDPAEVKRLFDFLEFRTLHERLGAALGSLGAGDVGRPDAVAVLEAEVVEPDRDAVAAVVAAGAGLDVGAAWAGQPARSDLLGVAVVVDPGQALVQWWPAGRLAELADLLVGAPLRAHQAKELLRGLRVHGIDPTGLELDTAIAAYLIDPAETRYDVGALLERFTGRRLPGAGEAAQGQLALGLDGATAAPELVAARSALAVHHLAPALTAALAAQGMQELNRAIEVPLVRVLARMEDVGVGVDIERLRALQAQLNDDVARLTGEIHAAAGHPFNVNSTPQLRQVLFDELGLAPSKKTKTGFSTDAATLERMVGQHPIVELLLAYREVEKLRSTYGEGLLAEVAADGRIHATFNQTVARTGRLSSDQPNLHNIPVRSEEGRRFREAFVPAAGFTLLVADYNQIELRCIAHLAEDPGLIDAFESGRDIHTATASRVFGVDADHVTLDMRAKAKMVSYGLAYGMEAYGLGQRLNIPTDEAARILDAYFAAFPNVKAYMERTVAEARTRGYTETLFGRRRPIPELTSSNFRIRQAGERQAMNAGIQGLAADIFKKALVDLDAALEAAGHRSRIVLQVHDEVVVEVAAGEDDTVRDLTVTTMAAAARLRVRLAVNVAAGSSWAAAKG
jgi:DNA polymerase-1